MNLCVCARAKNVFILYEFVLQCMNMCVRVRQYVHARTYMNADICIRFRRIHACI